MHGSLLPHARQLSTARKGSLLRILIVGLVALLCTASSAGSSGWVSERVTVRATAYCPCARCCGEHANGKTAIGRDAFAAGVAVDPAVIPLRARLDIPGYPRGPNGNGSWIIADDTKAEHTRVVDGLSSIDLRFRTHEEAQRYGKKTIEVTVWRKQTD